MTPQNKVNVMIDIETAGTKPGSPIVQIAAVPFSCNPDQLPPVYAFNAYASLASCEEVGLVPSRETMAWWSMQDPALRMKVFSSNVHIKDSLENFYLWCKSLGAAPVVWGNGANFDITLLEAAFAACRLPVPWHYRDIMCYRTLTTKFQLPLAVKANIPPNLQKHDALADAQYQARVLVATHNYIEEASDGLLRIL